METIIDVAIVGAGLSGLQAALDLHNAGRSVVVLEARDRVGGKTNTTERADGKGRQEIGATWLNDTNQCHVWAYCEKFHLTPIVQASTGLVASEDEDGNCHLFPFGGTPQFHRSDIDNIVEIRDKVEAASLSEDTFKQPNRTMFDNLTFETWLQELGASQKALLTARVWTRGTLGQDPGDVSALAFLEIARGALGIIKLRYDGEHGAQRLRLREGTQAISIGMSQLLPTNSIKLNSPITSIVQDPSGNYTLTTTKGAIFKAKKIIVSIPSPTYKNITFEPPLPPQKQLYIDSTRYGCFVKYICLFKSPFWRQVGACGLAQSFQGPMNHCRDTSDDDGNNYALTCFLVSEPGRKWLALNPDGRRDAVLKQLGSLFGVGHELVKSEFLDSITSDWMQDKWAGWGCPFPATPPNILGTSDDSKSFHAKFNGLYFVGTEFTEEFRGYMEGAIRSGKRGASQVMADW